MSPTATLAPLKSFKPDPLLEGAFSEQRTLQPEASATFGNDCHDPEGRFCETGGEGNAAGKEASTSPLVGSLAALKPEYQQVVHDQIKKIPTDVQAILQKYGVKVVAKDKVTRTASGKGLDYGGVYNPKTHEVEVSNSGFADLETHAKQGDANFVLHELGHAFDYALGRVSQHPAFKALWKDAEPKPGSYFQKPFGGTNPREELLAEAYANVWQKTEPRDFKLTPSLKQIATELRHNINTGEEFTVVGLMTFNNDCHDPHSGEFCGEESDLPDHDEALAHVKSKIDKAIRGTIRESDAIAAIPGKLADHVSLKKVEQPDESRSGKQFTNKFWAVYVQHHLVGRVNRTQAGKIQFIPVPPTFNTNPLDLFTSLMEFANPYHDEHGRFTTGESEGGPATDMRDWARKNGHTVGDRGRISQEIQDAYKAAHSKAVGNPSHYTGSGNFKTDFATASKGLTNDLRLIPTNETVNGPGWSMPNGYPGPKLNDIEQRVRDTGAVLHNEITARLAAGGITEPAAVDRQALIAQFKDLQTKISDTEVPWAERQRIRDEVWGKHISYSDPEHIQQLKDAITKDYPDNDAKVAVLREKLKGVNEQIIAANQADNAYTTAYRGTALQVLSEARDGNYGNMSFEKVTSSNKDIKAAIALAGQAYPDEWVVKSDRQGDTTVKGGKRGLHQETATKEGDYNSTITTAKDPSPRAITDNQYYATTVHELGHRMEGVLPHIKAMEWSFWARRSTGESPSPLRRLVPGSSYKSDEKAVADKFTNPYTGKLYNESAKSPFEVFTMGVQQLMGGTEPIWKDKDYAHFTLGLLASG